MPLLTSFGLLIYALIPMFFPHIAYAGLLLGTVVFSVAAGLSEVMLSPTIAAIPSENPQREMSMLHSLYAFGVVTTVLFSTAFLLIFEEKNWTYLILFLACLPIVTSVLFMLSPMPEIQGSETGKNIGEEGKRKTLGLALCVACIFFGSCAESTMSSWISTYMETALSINKTMGDVLGVAVFAVLLGLGRILYAKFGKNISKVLLWGMISASICYLVVGLSSSAVIAFIACILTGFCTSMLWPGTLIMMEEKVPNVGVAGFSLMAVGGDLGASVAPQLMGVVVDKVSASGFAQELGAALHITAEQVGLKAGMLVSALFPIIGIAIVLSIMRYFKKNA